MSVCAYADATCASPTDHDLLLVGYTLQRYRYRFVRCAVRGRRSRLLLLPLVPFTAARDCCHCCAPSGLPSPDVLLPAAHAASSSQLCRWLSCSWYSFACHLMRLLRSDIPQKPLLSLRSPAPDRAHTYLPLRAPLGRHAFFALLSPTSICLSTYLLPRRRH